jgi:serine/threonine protein kinase
LVEPTVISGYVLHERIAIGGMAEVYLASDLNGRSPHQSLVIKRLLPHLLTVPTAHNQFEDEARLSMRLTHPNIPEGLDYGVESGAPYLVLPYISGVSVKDLSNHCLQTMRSPDAGLVAHIGASTSNALQYFHQQTDASGRCLSHRDVTPDNLIVGVEGEIFLIDFGIAQAQQPKNEHTANLNGKHGFQAPEITSGGALDGRVDIYSLGVSLLRFWSNLPIEHISSFSYDDWCTALKQNAGDCEALLDCLLKAIEPNPADRFQTAGEMAKALSQLEERFDARTTTDWLRQHWGEQYQQEAQRTTQIFATTAPEGMDRTQALAPIQDSTINLGSMSSGSQEVSLIRNNSSQGLQPPIVRDKLSERRYDPTVIDDISREFSGRFTNPMIQLPWHNLKVFRIPLLLIIAASLLGAFISKSLFERAVERRMGKVMLDIVPSSNLKIFIDGQERLSNKTPMFLTEISPGSHSLIVQRDGFREIETSILIEPSGLTDVVLKLERLGTSQAYVTFVLDIEKCTLQYDTLSREIYSGQTVKLPANRTLDLKLTSSVSGITRNLSIKLNDEETFKLRFSLL